MALSRKSKIIIGVSAGILLLIIVVGSIFATRKDTPEVTTVKVETRKELRSTVTSSGEVRPIQFMNLTSEVQGRIEEKIGSVMRGDGMRVSRKGPQRGHVHVIHVRVREQHHVNKRKL